jgi:tetrathionate reductase subunit B
MKSLIVDVRKCNGCYNCQIACKDEHVANDWTPYAKPQPDTGHFWLKLNEYVRGTVPKVKMHYIPILCQHCDDAPCIKSCKIEGALYKRKDGVVIIDPQRCTGCRNCVDACPYGAIYFNDNLILAQKCTMCAHLLDRGWKEPRCVDVCPTGALTFGEEQDLKSLAIDARELYPEYKTKPRVYYIGIPGKFVAGAIYDPDEDECIEVADISLIDQKTGEVFKTVTDNFGDFWLNGLKTGTFSLKIEKIGYSPVEIKLISTEKDVNLGDIKLFKNVT